MNPNTFLRPCEKYLSFSHIDTWSLLDSCQILFWKRFKVISCPAPSPCLAPGAAGPRRKEWKLLGQSRLLCGSSVLMEAGWKLRQAWIGFPALMLASALGKFFNYSHQWLPQLSKRRITCLRAGEGVGLGAVLWLSGNAGWEEDKEGLGYEFSRS